MRSNKPLNITPNKVAGQRKFLDGPKMNEGKYGKLDWIVNQMQLYRNDSLVKSPPCC